MKYKTVFRTAFDFYEKWTPAPTTDKEWKQLAADASATSAKHRDPFLTAMLGAVVDEIGRQAETTIEYKNTHRGA